VEAPVLRRRTSPMPFLNTEVRRDMSKVNVAELEGNLADHMMCSSLVALTCFFAVVDFVP